MIQVVQIVPAIGMESSGPSYSVPGLCRGLQSSGCSVSLHFCGGKPERSFEYPVSCYSTSLFPHSRLGRSPEMEEGLLVACQGVDVIHNNSFWMYPNVYGCRVVRKLRCQNRGGENSVKIPKLVNAPRGTLAPWALEHHRLQKMLFGLFAGQYAAMRATDMWHATCEKEYEEIRSLGFRQPVAIVPIGMDVPKIEDYSFKWGTAEKKKLVFFGRLHQVKAVDRLLDAWHLLVLSRRPLVGSWELLIAGPDGGLRPRLEQMIAAKRIPRVQFVGELHGEGKYQFLSNADLYVLPSFTENFGITVAESLACGTPVIASTGTPWKGLVENNCGWWVDNSVKSIANALFEAFTLGSRIVDDSGKTCLEVMGENGRQWIARDFSWYAVGEKMKAAYEWLLSPRSVARPDWVIAD